MTESLSEKGADPLPSPVYLHQIEPKTRDNAAGLPPFRTDSNRSEKLLSPAAVNVRIGTVLLPTRYFLAPLAGYTNLAFRLAVRELGGVGLATTDLINARALRFQSRKTMELVHTCPQDRPLAVQIYGSDSEDLVFAAQWFEARGISTIDINMGCPVHKVTRNGAGSALLCEPGKAVDLVHKVASSVGIPVTVKMRLGWDETDLSAPGFAREFETAGIAAVTIHGRTRAQGFGGSVDLEGIRAVVQAVKHIPVIGNGDLRTTSDAEHMLAFTGCSAVAIGRGALLNPWIFRQLVQTECGLEPEPEPTNCERLDFMERHFQLLVDDRGERLGCLLFRKVANWYCRVLNPGREIQQRLVRLASKHEFDHLLDRMRAMPICHLKGHGDRPSPAIAVPRGPIEYW